MVVRQAMLELSSFEDAVALLRDSDKFMAPHFFTLSGPGHYEGAVISKDRVGGSTDAPPLRRLSEADGTWYLLQTNDDVNKPPLDARREQATLRLIVAAQDQVSPEWVFSQQHTPPMRN